MGHLTLYPNLIEKHILIYLTLWLWIQTLYTFIAVKVYLMCEGHKFMDETPNRSKRSHEAIYCLRKHSTVQ